MSPTNSIEPFQQVVEGIGKYLRNVSTTSRECWCDVHRGAFLFQMDAVFKRSGKHIRILRYGSLYQFVIGTEEECRGAEKPQDTVNLEHILNIVRKGGY